MHKILAILLALTMMLTLAACDGGNSGNSSNSGDSAPKTTAASGDLVKAELPSGWSLVTGTEMFGMDEADFICPTEKYEFGDPYLQVEEYPQDLDTAKACSGSITATKTASIPRNCSAMTR